MKTFFLVLCLLANSVWAEGDGGSHFPQQDKPHLQERFQFQTTFFLDRANFGRLQISLLDLNHLVPRAARSAGNDVNVEFRTDSRREGTLVFIVIEGSGEEMLRFFDSLVNRNIGALIGLMRANAWIRPPDKYRKYWDDVYADIRREIEVQALSQWTAKQKDPDAGLCEHMMGTRESHVPAPKSPRLDF
jgi:hypothetical protein